MLDQGGSRAQVILHRAACHLTRLIARGGDIGVQHQGNGPAGRIITRITQGLMVKCDLARHLIHRLAQQVGQHIGPDLPRLTPCVWVSGGGHPQRQLGADRARLGLDGKCPTRRCWEIYAFAAPKGLHLTGGGKHRGFVVGRGVFGAQHKVIGMPAAGNRHARTPARQIVDHRPFLGNPGRMVQGHDTRARTHADVACDRRHGGPRYRRVRVWPAKGMEVPFRRPDGDKAVFISEFRAL